jgi:ParB-like chromosome segregation protein Spo0J
MASKPARIELVALDKINEAVANPKDHDLDGIVASLRRFGFVEPMVMNETTGRLVAGHGRTEALKMMKQVGEPAPERIVAKNGSWLVPVLRGIRFASDDDAEAYLVASNRLPERGGWIDELLAASLKRLKSAESLDGVGFSSAEAEDIIAEAERRKKASAEVVPDDAELPKYDDGTQQKFQCPKCGEKFSKLQAGGKIVETRVGGGDIDQPVD